MIKTLESSRTPEHARRTVVIANLEGVSKNYGSVCALRGSSAAND